MFGRNPVLVGPDGVGTPDELARQRAMVQQLMVPYGRAENIGQGIAGLMNGIATGIKTRQLNKQQAAGEASGAAARHSILTAMLGGGSGEQGAGGDGAVYRPDSSLAGKIAETANAVGANPEDLATLISYETGGTFNPTQGGPVTQHGKHRGLIQFGEPQAQKYGVDWSNPIDSQLGSNGAVAKYLNDAGFRPGMGMLDLYSAVNAGHVGRYNASDANNGGAPGSVRDKVEDQMGGHRAKAKKLLSSLLAGDAGPSPVPAGSAMMPSAQAPAPQLPQPQIAPQQQQFMTTDKPQQMMPQQGGGQELDYAALLQQAENPWLDDASRNWIYGLVQKRQEQQMQARDPEYQQAQKMRELDFRKKQFELEQMQNPAPEKDRFENVGGRMIKISPDGTATEIYAPPETKQEAGGVEYGLQPVVTQDKDGKYHLFQVAKDGSGAKEINLPYGWTPQQQYLDTGTGFQAMPKQGVGAGPVVQKDLIGAESQKAIGDAQGKAIAAAPADIQAGENALDLLTNIESDKYLERGTGFSSNFNLIPGTGGYDFQNMVDQAKSGAFLSAIQQMRGMGSLSNAEGETATAAVTRMNTSTSKEAFLRALADYRKIIEQGIARAKTRLVGGSQNPGNAQGGLPSPRKQSIEKNGYQIEEVD